MSRLLLLFALTCAPLIAQPARVYRGPGHVIVFRGCGLAIRPEGPLRARCAVIPPYTREETVAAAPAFPGARYDRPGDPAAHLHDLGLNGSVEVVTYMPGFTRLRYYPPPGPAIEIRPASGLIELIKRPGIRVEDIGRHLLHVDAGVPVDWGDPTGY